MGSGYHVIAEKSGYGHVEIALAGLRFEWDESEGHFFATTEDAARADVSSYAAINMPGVLKLGSTPVSVNNAAGKLILAALEQDGASANDVLTWDGAAWAPAAPATSAPADAQYVTLATDGDLDNERVLTGTADQITVTDGGAGSTVTLSLPQDIDTGATPTFADLTLSNELTLQSPSQDYLFTDRGAALALQAQTSAQPSLLEIFTKDGDGTDGLGIQLYAKGSPSDIATAAEFLQIIYAQSATTWDIHSHADGTGTIRSLRVGNVNFPNSIVVDVNGDVSISEDLDVTGNTTLDGKLNVGTVVASTLSSGAMTVSGIYHTIAPESGITDNFDTITGDTYDLVIIRNVSSSNEITVRHLQDNIFCDGATNITMNHVADTLICLKIGSNWLAKLFWSA